MTPMLHKLVHKLPLLILYALNYEGVLYDAHYTRQQIRLLWNSAAATTRKQLTCLLAHQKLTENMTGCGTESVEIQSS